MVFGRRSRLASESMFAWHVQHTLLHALRKERAVKTRVQVFRNGHPDEQATLRARPKHGGIQRTDRLGEGTQEDPTLLAIQIGQLRHMEVVACVRQHSLDEMLV